METGIYLCIDLKSFYASVECVERGLDPLLTNLVVADSSRTEKTICLAVTPSLKSFGIGGRARLFEVVSTVKAINIERRKKLSGGKFIGKSCNQKELENNPGLELSYIVAPPRMALYKKYSTKIMEIYLKYVSINDIHPYSIDEVFIDITHYLGMYKMTAEELAVTIIKNVLEETGITATAGIGTNMYLPKIAMDIEAKKMQPDENGVRVAFLDEMSYREKLWTHRPLTDFWRIGKGISKRLWELGLYTMGDIARYSMTDYGEDKLYREFGVNAELIIDHAWGWESTLMSDVKNYRPQNSSTSSGQVLMRPYKYDEAKLIVREMAELVALGLVEKGLLCNQIVLDIGYDIENMKTSSSYRGEVKTDYYGRAVPKPAHGTGNIGSHTSSTMVITDAAIKLFEEIVDKNLLVRRVTITANHLENEKDIEIAPQFEQLDMFTDYEEEEKRRKARAEALEKERKLQEATIKIKKKFGKNAILRGMNFKEGATTMQRNDQIGGHKA